MSGRVFNNYRRGDEPGFAGRLFDRLEQTLGADRLFMDVDNIAAGHDFVRVLEDEVGKCDVLLAIIGKSWIEARDDTGQLRLDSPSDFVRIEIESALNQGKRLIPVLVNDARMPRAEDLPGPLKPLSRRNAVRLTHERFKADAQGLIKIIETSLAEVEAARTLQTEEERHAAEVALKRKHEEEAERATEVERQARERAQQQAAQGLSAAEIVKAEELANWDFIKQASDATELRNHLARFPGGVTERYARTALEDIVWKELGLSPDVTALEAFIAEFPKGRHSSEASSRLGFLKGKADAERETEELKRQEIEAWAKASAAGTVDAYEAYISAWPASANARTAKALVKQLSPGTGFGSTLLRTVASAAIVLSLATGAYVLGMKATRLSEEERLARQEAAAREAARQVEEAQATYRREMDGRTLSSDTVVVERKGAVIRSPKR